MHDYLAPNFYAFINVLEVVSMPSNIYFHYNIILGFATRLHDYVLVRKDIREYWLFSC
jgi:hypothetical protein